MDHETSIYNSHNCFLKTSSQSTYRKLKSIYQLYMFANNSVGANYTYLPIEHYDIGKLKGKGNTKPLSVFFTPTCFSAPWKLQNNETKALCVVSHPPIFSAPWDCDLATFNLRLMFLWSCIQLFINIFTVGLWCLGIPKNFLQTFDNWLSCNNAESSLRTLWARIRKFKKFGRTLDLNVAFWWQNLLLNGPDWHICY